jgi:hypothetical protein
MSATHPAVSYAAVCATSTTTCIPNKQTFVPVCRKRTRETAPRVVGTDRSLATAQTPVTQQPWAEDLQAQRHAKAQFSKETRAAWCAVRGMELGSQLLLGTVLINTGYLPSKERGRVYVPTWLIGAHTFEVQSRKELNWVANDNPEEAIGFSRHSPTKENESLWSDPTISPVSGNVQQLPTYVWSTETMPDRTCVGVLDYDLHYQNKVFALVQDLDLSLDPQISDSVTTGAPPEVCGTHIKNDTRTTHWLPLLHSATLPSEVRVFSLCHRSTSCVPELGTVEHSRILLAELEGTSAQGNRMSREEVLCQQALPIPESISSYSFRVVSGVIARANKQQHRDNAQDDIPASGMARSQTLRDSIANQPGVSHSLVQKKLLQGKDKQDDLEDDTSEDADDEKSWHGNSAQLEDEEQRATRRDPDEFFLENSQSTVEHEAEEEDVMVLLQKTLSEFSTMCLSQKAPSLASFNERHREPERS